MQERPELETAAEEAKETTTDIPKKVLERAKLEERLDVLKANSETAAPEEAGARQELVRNQEKRIRLHEAMHDNTGVLKGDYFGRDVATVFEAYDFPKKENGEYELPPDFENRHLFLVNMGELDRLNAGGDHTTGDRGLELTAHHIEGIVQKTLIENDPTLAKDPDRLAASYELYRAAGNDFAFKLENASHDLAEEIRRKLSSNLDVSQAIPGEDPIPLSASRVNLADTIRLLNDLSPEDRAIFEDDPKKETSAVAASKEMLQQMNDKAKLETRMSRMVEKIKAGDEEQAKKFYDQFQIKSLGAIFAEDPSKPLDYETFKTKLEEHGGLDSDPTWPATLAEISREEAKRQFESRRSSQQKVDRIVSDIAAKTYLEYQPPPLDERLASESKAPPAYAAPEATRGQEALQDLQKKVNEAVAEAEGKSCEEDSLDPACQKWESTKLDLEIEQASRDTLTGLEQRGRLFGRLEDGLENGEPVSTVFIDMAFLKYFDKEAGRETGNAAIKTASKLLDNIAEELSTETVKVEAYRIGGDEFAFSVRGGDETALQNVLEALRKKQEEAPAVPLQDTSALGSYFDQELSFNFGAHHAKSKNELKTFLKESGIPLEHEGESKENEELAEYMLRFSDKQLEIQKAVNRMTLLLGERAKVGSKDEGKYAQLLKYSQKAIFGEEGTEKLEAWHAELLSAGSSEEKLNIERKIDEEMLSYTLDKIREKNAKNEKYQASIDKAIEDRVRDLYLEQKIASLESEIEKLRKTLVSAKTESEALSGENKELRQRIELLEGEKQHIDALRTKLSG